jgi:hypothetical protein
MFIERDPNVNKLSEEVFSKLNDIFKQIDPKPDKTKTENDVSFVSMEDAAAELLTIYKNETN